MRIHVGAPHVEVVDTIGAGDAFGACLAGALTCTRVGAEPPWKSEMLALS
jgi:sugar/nucleoside kinase (ribokinase family)